MNQAVEIDMTDNDELADVAGQVANSKPSEEGFVRRIGKTLQRSLERKTVTLPDGRAVSAAGDRLMNEHPGMEFLGATGDILVPVSAGHGLENWEVFDPRRHTPEQAAKKRFRVHEYFEIPAENSVEQGPLGSKVQIKYPEIWVIQNGDFGSARCIGRTLSANLIERLGATSEPKDAELVEGGNLNP